MEPLLIILVPGVIGGLVLSLLIARNRRGTAPTFVPRNLPSLSPSLINMSSIKVEGLGGLGMVAAVIAVAIADSRIRMAVLAAMILGIALAVTLIALRRREADRSESGPGGDAMLHIIDNPQHVDAGGAAQQASEEKVPSVSDARLVTRWAH
jgi:hypothetical protein